MSKLGLAYLAVNRSVLDMMVQNNFPVSSLPGPKLYVESGDAPVPTEGFQFSTDLATLVSASAVDDAFLRIDLDDVLDLVDTVSVDALLEAGYAVTPGHDRFAYGVDPFQISLADFAASHDGFEFTRATDFTIAEQAEAIALVAPPPEETNIAVAVDPFETSFRECDDVATFDELPSEDALLVGLDAAAPTPAVKTHPRPWMPRGQYFAWLRAQGTLQPRKSAEQPVAVIKPKQANKATGGRREKTPEQLRAIRRSYAIRGKKSAA